MVDIKVDVNKYNGSGTVLSVVTGLIWAEKEKRARQQDLADEYRPEIARRFGIAEDQLNSSHFKQAFEENGVLAELQEANRNGGFMLTVASITAAVVGVIVGQGAMRGINPGRGQDKAAAEQVGGIVSALGAGFFAGSFVRKAFRAGFGARALEDTAHMRIMELKEKQNEKVAVDAVDVYDAVLALTPKDADAVRKAYGAPYHTLDEKTRQDFFERQVPDGARDLAEQIAQKINNGARPQGLLFSVVQEKLADNSQRQSDSMPVPDSANVEDQGIDEVHMPVAPERREKNFVNRLEEEEGQSEAVVR